MPWLRPSPWPGFRLCLRGRVGLRLRRLLRFELRLLLLLEFLLFELLLLKLLLLGELLLLELVGLFLPVAFRGLLCGECSCLLRGKLRAPGFLFLLRLQLLCAALLLEQRFTRGRFLLPLLLLQRDVGLLVAHGGSGGRDLHGRRGRDDGPRRGHVGHLGP
ncbi:hypothetical protein CSX04_01671 [Burkholderia cepacia]|nr:hypothetical protein CSX04_01671 [Burkholderia cepacia]